MPNNEKQPLTTEMAVEALRRSEEQFRSLIEEMPYSIVIHRGSKVLFMNQATSRMMGYEWDEVKDMFVSDFIHRDDLHLVAQRQAALERGEVVPAQGIRFLKRDGGIVIAETHGYTTTFDGEEARIAVHRDLTAQRKAEETAQELRDHLEQRVEERTQKLKESEKSARHQSRLLRAVTDVVTSFIDTRDLKSAGSQLVPRSEKHLVFFPAFDELGVAMPVAPRDVRQDRPAAVRMIRIVGVGQREIADAREDRFDPIQPRGVGRREDELHVVVGGPVGHLASLVRREVVEHEVEARRERVARANVREEQQHFARALAPVAAHHEPIGVDVVGREVLARAMEPPIRRAQPRRVSDLAPRAPMIRAHFDGPELVETDHPAVRRCHPVERTDAFFLAAKSGSGLSFQVFVRWNEKPWSRRMRPSVVACSSLTTPQRTRWAASFRRDHTVNGRPRSCGRVPATSRMTLTSSGAYFDGRPDAFRGRSAAKPPVLNRRINARTYSSWRYNRPAMARARIPCPEKATTCARRKYAAVFVVFKTRVSRRPSASVSSRTYRHTGTSFGSHVCPYWIRRALKVQDAFRYEALVREAINLTGSEYGFLRELHGETLRVMVHEGVMWSQTEGRDEQVSANIEKDDYAAFDELDNLFGVVVATGKPILSNNAPADSRASKRLPAGRPELRSFLGAPILKGGKADAMIGVANGKQAYTDTDLRTMEYLCQAASVVFDNHARTEREASLEEQLQQAAKMEALGVLAGGIAHDFNNLLTTIQGNAEVALTSSSNLDGKMREMLQHIVTASDNAAGLCNQMLAYAGRGVLSTQCLEFNMLIS